MAAPGYQLSKDQYLTRLRRIEGQSDLCARL